MEPIRVVWGTGTGPTELAAYDAALSAANIHEYNLIELSSVIPADATIDSVGRAPDDLGAPGDGLYVVQAAATTREGPVSAALTWTRSADGSGIFYEADGPAVPDVIADRATRGIDACVSHRDRTFGEPQTQLATMTVEDFEPSYGTALVAAVYGTGSSLLESELS